MSTHGWRSGTQLSPEVVGHPSAAPLYDARRDVHYAKPAWRGWMHLVWFELSLVAGTLLIVRADGAARVAAVSVYSATVSGLFGVSALYHRGHWGPAAQRILQRADHVMIFLLIAGTATPAFLLGAPQPLATVCLIVLWTLTLCAAALHLVWMHAPEKLVGATFIALGWTAGMALPAMWIHTGATPAALLGVGGVLYTAGAISYHRRSPDPNPAVFGYHEVFHAYVCAAAACQYVAVMLLLR